ncbi:hypothetical protein RQP46_003801 [Phenoliferia psychrophenolica]
MESELELKHKLLLAQAVVRLGSEDWSAVASLVQTAPLDTDALTPKLCEDTFTALVNEHQLDLSNTLVPEARASRKLAHKLYQDRIHEIASSLASRTSEAAKLQHDLTEITDGAWDDRVLQTVPPELIHEVITALPLSTSTPHALVGDSLAGDRKGSKRKDSEQPEASPPPRDSRKRLKTDDPLDDSTPSTSSNRAQPKKTEDTKKNQQFRRAIGGLLETLQRFEKAWPFSTPVNKKDAPTYYDAIPRPVCLADIIRNVKQSDIVTNGEVQRDVALMFANAVQFNGVQDEIAECARLSWAEFERLMHTHIQQGFSNT